MPSVSNNPLEQALGRGCCECIRILIDSTPGYGVDSCIGPDGLLPVHVAAREGHLQVLRYLQTAGASLQGLDTKGSNGLHYAARAGQQRAVRWLLRHGLHPVLNTNLESPSHIASQHQHMEIVAILAKHTNTGNINNNNINNSPSEDTKQLDSGNSSLSSSTNPPSSLTTTTTTTNCSCIVNSSSSSSSSSSEELNNYTIRSVNSFFLHPPKSSSTSGSNPNSSSFYLHPRLITSAIEEEATYSTTITNNHHNHYNSKSGQDHSHQQSQNQSQKPSFRLHNSPPSSPPGNRTDGGELPSINSTSFHLHDDQNISSISVQQSLDYSIETTMAPVNNQFVMSSPVVVQSEPIDMTKLINHNNKNGAPGNNKMGIPPPPPPPPPPPMPTNFKPPNSNNNNNNNRVGKIVLGKNSGATTTTTSVNLATDLNVKQIVREKEKVMKCVSVNGLSTTTPPIENDYEDIEEFQSQKVNGGNGEILNRNPPPPPLPGDNERSQFQQNSQNDTYNNNYNNNINSNSNNNKILAGLKKLNVNGKQVPFIPPQFPTPPQQDQLIKPSEYLKSIKTKTNLKGTLSHGPRIMGNHNNNSRCESETKVDETNAEDEFEEINPEVNVIVKVGGTVSPPPPPPGPGKLVNSTSSNNNTNGGGGMIRPDDLMKVNLRKTATTRTKSAPPLGRVINGDGNANTTKCEVSSPTYGKSPPPLNTKAAVIAELEQSSQLGGVREWKEELRRRQLEEEKNAVKELAQHYSPLNFVAEVPDTDTTGQAIPPWKRLLVAKKAAERARKEAEEQLKMDTEKKRMASIPPWRKQLLQRRESDGKCAQ